jgi:lycopene cyclase domain-containing protein
MTYLVLDAVFVGVGALVLVAVAVVLRRRGVEPIRGRVVAGVVLILAVFTAVFDNLMIAAELFGYDDEHLLGLSVGRAPVEDVGYPLAVALLLPALWRVLERRQSVDGPARPSLIRQLFVASRPLSWVNTAFPFAAAVLMTTREVTAVLVVGTLFFLVPYNLLMYGVNDVFDHESDLTNPRKGGAEGAVLDPGIHRATLLASTLVPVPFVVYLVAVGNPASWLVLAGSLFAVVAYSAPRLRFKERPVLDSLTSSTHFVSPALYGFVLAGAAFTPTVVLVLVAFFLWGGASQAFGAVQDIAADRAAGIGSIATAFGARATVRLALVAYVLAGLLMLGTRWPGPLAAALVAPYVAIVWPYRSVADDDAASANRGWRRFLGANYAVGFLVTMLLIWASREHG